MQLQNLLLQEYNVEIISGLLAQADRSQILAALATFSQKHPNQWCPPGHPGNNGQIPDWRTLHRVPAFKIIEAVAASAPNHCIDGWSYASRALSALLAGDSHAVRHLSYYAQLRAGLSILGNLGVGVFNRTNFIVTAAGEIKRLDTAPSKQASGPGMGTHDMVWAALKEWTDTVPTSRIFLDLIKIRGNSLKECLDAIWPGMPSTGAAKTLIEAWGVDLKRGKEQHRYRNISSYSPQAMNPLIGVAPDGLKFVQSFWSLFEPTAGSSFDQLDRFLLRSLLLKQHRTISSNNNYREGAIYKRYDNLPASIRSLVSIDFLTNIQNPRNPELIRRANSSSIVAQPTEMLARAFLLLRVATGFTYSSFVEAGVFCSLGELRPWIDPWAEARGFWSPTAPLTDPIDLWSDVEIALDDYRNSLTPEPRSMYEWMQRDAKGLPVIYEAERIGVWSFCA